jgi:ribonuclease HI
MIPINSRGTFFMGEAQKWFEANLVNADVWSGRDGWVEIWATTCHSFWNWRNKEAYEEDFIRPTHPVHSIMQKTLEYNTAARLNDSMANKPATVQQIGWKPPKEGFIKLNTDEAVVNSQTAGCGGVIRGTQGEWIRGFAKNIGWCNAFVAELWGVYEGLKCARSLGFNKVEVNIDDIAVVNVIKKRKSHSLIGRTILQQIWKLLDEDWEVDISHSFREANRCADALATAGCALSNTSVFYDDCPLFISSILVDDRMGITTPRLIAL